MRFTAVSIVVIGIAFGLVLPAAGQAGQVIAAKTMERFYDPIEMRAELFSQMLNLDLDHLGLVACHDGKLDFIPYQFDEWTEDGEMVLKFGKNNNAEKANNKLDPQDQLVFMAREMGDRVEPAMWQELSERGIEIEARDPLTQERAWAYLLYFHDRIPPDKIKATARISTETPEFRGQGDTYGTFGTNIKVGKKLYRTCATSKIFVTPAAGGNGLNFIDHNKFRVSVSMLFGMIKFKIDESNSLGEVDRYFNGPVRGLVRNWVALKLPMGLKSPRIVGFVYIYDTMNFIPVRIRFPFNPGYVLTDFQLKLGYDLHPINGLGMKYYSNTNPQGFLMDGYMSPEEQKEYNDELDDWRCIVGPNGWMVHRSIWDEDYRKQAKIAMEYIDDVEHESPPEEFPGDLGYYYTKTTVKSMDPRSYFFQMEWYWPYNLYTPDGPDMKAIKNICNVRDYPLMIRVGKQEVENTGAVLTPMSP